MNCSPLSERNALSADVTRSARPESGHNEALREVPCQPSVCGQSRLFSRETGTFFEMNDRQDYVGEVCAEMSPTSLTFFSGQPSKRAEVRLNCRPMLTRNNQRRAVFPWEELPL